MIKPLEIEYSELVSNPDRGNWKFGVKITTTPETYEQDLVELIAEVKIKLNEISDMRKREKRDRAPS